MAITPGAAGIAGWSAQDLTSLFIPDSAEGDEQLARNWQLGRSEQIGETTKVGLPLPSISSAEMETCE
jgi:hypothetical protein